MISTQEKLVKLVIKKRYSCNRHKVLPYVGVTLGQLSTDRKEAAISFLVMGTDFAVLTYFKTKSYKEIKVYLSIFSCSMSRVENLELIQNLAT